MKYTESGVGGLSDTGSKRSIVRDYLVRVPLAIPRLTNEISKKIVFLDREYVVKVFRTSLIGNLLLFVPDVVGVVKHGVQSLSPLTFSKLISFALLGTATFAYLDKQEEVQKVKKRREKAKPRRTVKEVVQEEEKVEEKEAFIIIDKDGTEFDVNSLPDEDDETYMEITKDILDGSYPEKEFNEVFSQDLNTAMKEAYMVERDFAEYSSEESIDSIIETMYAGESVEFTKDEQAVSFEELSAMLDL